MLRRTLRTIDRIGEEIFDHPIRNAKILGGAAAAGIIMEKLQIRYDAWRENKQSTEEMPEVQPPIGATHEQ